MLYSKGTEYAIRSLAWMAKENGSQARRVEDIARLAEVPAPFLAKTFQKLAKDGILWSVKGPSGGYVLARLPSQLSLLDIVASIDGLYDMDGCILGQGKCSDTNSCPIHKKWLGTKKGLLDFLKTATIADIALSLKKSKTAKKG
jgi:Rrf2 family transcriptional regulator, iron-sulfur cluster assembly transcription factor